METITNLRSVGDLKEQKIGDHLECLLCKVAALDYFIIQAKRPIILAFEDWKIAIKWDKMPSARNIDRCSKYWIKHFIQSDQELGHILAITIY